MHKSIFFIISFIFLSLQNQAQSDKLSEGIALFEQAQKEEAKAIFSELLTEQPGNDQVIYYMGRIIYEEGDYDAAVVHFQQAIELNKKSEYYSWLGATYGTIAQKSSIFKQVGYAKKIRVAFEEAVKLDGSNIDARYNLVRYYIQAPGFMGGSMEKAGIQAREIKKLNPVLGIIVDAEMQIQDGEDELAEQTYKMGIAEHPEETNLLYQLASFYEKNKNYEAAVISYEKIPAMDSSRLDAWYSIGRIGAIHGVQLTKAEASLKIYLNGNPEGKLPPPAWAHYRLGMVYENMKNDTMARKEYETALGLDPKLEEAQEALEDL